MAKVVCMGECLVDVTPTENGYENRIGGAPYNVCACVARLGGEAYYLGKLGGDCYADFLKDKIAASGVKCDFIAVDKSLKTTLAIVSLDKNGDRSFTFERDNTADLNFCEDDVREDMFAEGDILHFCSVGLVGKSEFAHKKAINIAKNKGVTISFDVNIRANLWDSVDDCIAKIKEFLPYADLLKVSEEELELLAAGKTEEDKIKDLFCHTDAHIVIVTKGGEGAVAYDRNLAKCLSRAKKVKVTNTTGAGDNFIGAVLYLLAKGDVALNIQSMQSALDFASAHTAAFLSSN